MRVVIDSSPAEWLSHAAPLLTRAEAENNLLLGLAAQAAADTSGSDWEMHLLRTVDGEATVGAAMATRLNLILSRQSEVGLSLIADELVRQGVSPPGAVGPDQIPATFVRLWTQRTGATATLRQDQRIHECHRVVELPRAAGRYRQAAAADVPVLADWWVAFHIDVGAARMDDDPAAAVGRLISRQDLFVWEDAGRIVSCAATMRRTPHGAVVAFVYTPPVSRGRGYATSCVADLTRANLAAGADFCCLYTDLANPISNSIYARIGYVPVCDSQWWAASQEVEALF
ncbi:MAG: GNAT family N-acetyltransferase [Planctomycetaceae bacterium]